MKLVAAKAGRSDSADALTHVGGLMSASIQLHDDLVDAEDDYANRFVSYPLSLALRCMAGNEREWPGWGAVFESLYLSGSAETTLGVAARLADDAASEAKSISAFEFATAAEELREFSIARIAKLRLQREEVESVSD